MTTPSKVNTELKKLNINGEIVRDSSGYYYFTGDLFDVVPSIFNFNLRGWTTREIINRVNTALQTNKTNS
jgi:hypothetical protein